MADRLWPPSTGHMDKKRERWSSEEAIGGRAQRKGSALISFFLRLYFPLLAS